MGDKGFDFARLLTKERLIWALAVLLLGGWQGLTHYMSFGEDAQASMSQPSSRFPAAAPALEERVRALELFRAGEEVTVQGVKEEVEKMDAKLDQVLVMLASNNGRKPK